MSERNKLKVLLIGSISLGDIQSLEFSYKKAFESFGYEVITIDYGQHYKISFLNRALNKILTDLMKFKKSWGIRIYFGTKNLNKKIIEMAKQFNPDIVFFVKPTFIKASTVIALKKMDAIVFAWHPDDIYFNPRSGSRVLFRAMPFYDCHFTPRSNGLDELIKMGGVRSEWLPFSVNTEIYHPKIVNNEDRKNKGADVIFVGSYYENSRAIILEKLCESGYNVRVYGNEWKKCRMCGCLKKNKCLMYRAIYGDDYCMAMSASKIAIAFVGKISRDQHTTRTFEIPACKTFMLHERTAEATSFLKEGEEAEFFDINNFDELKSKIDFYLDNDKKRNEIAESGYKKILSYAYSYEFNIEKIMAIYKEIKNDTR